MFLATHRTQCRGFLEWLRRRSCFEHHFAVGTRNTHLPGTCSIGGSLRRQQNHLAAASRLWRRTSGPRQGLISSLDLGVVACYGPRQEYAHPQ